MNPLFDAVLALPTFVIALVLLGGWGAVAFAIHRFLVPRICGADGKRLGRFEAEVTSQIALAFGLLVSFNGVWDRGDRVRDAVLEEASALEAVLDESEAFTGDQIGLRAQAHTLVAAYAKATIETEWPKLSQSAATLDRPAELLALRKFGGASNEAVADAVKRVESARQIRIREGQLTMPRSRWIIVFVLAVLTLISIGALHGDAPRGRALALTLVSLAIAFCFMVLFVNGRPFIGEYAIQPVALRDVLARASK
jgi:hypothetical protein